MHDHNSIVVLLLLRWNRYVVNSKQNKVHLVDMKMVGGARWVIHGPILNGPLRGEDTRIPLQCKRNRSHIYWPHREVLRRFDGLSIAIDCWRKCKQISGYAHRGDAMEGTGSGVAAL